MAIRIGIAGITANPMGPKGGGENFPLILARALREAHPEAEIILFGPDGSRHVEGCRLIETGPSHSALASKGSKSVRRCSAEAVAIMGLKVQEWLFEQRDWGNVVLIDNDVATASLVGMTKLMRIPHLFIQHSFADTELLHIYQNIRRSGGHIVAIAQRQMEDARNIVGEELHSIIIPNGVDTRHIACRPYPPPLSDGRKTVILMGRGEQEDTKGWEFACKVVARANELGVSCRLLIAGPVNGSGVMDRIEPYTEEGMARHVGFLSSTDEREEFFSRAHAALSMSNPGGWHSHSRSFSGNFRECCSLVILECQAAGIPIVCSDSGGAEPCHPSNRIPLSILEHAGEDDFIDNAARRLVEVLTEAPDPSLIRSYAKSDVTMAREYLDFISELLRENQATADSDAVMTNGNGKSVHTSG